MKIKILYEDKDILAINKPSGISVHADGRTKEKTLTDWILKNYPKMENVGEPMFYEEKEIKRPGVVHRLDKDTSGVLLLAKTKKAHEFLKSQFQNREVKKVYNVVVSGWVKNDRGVVNKAIGRSPNDFRKKLAGRGARGELREAITEYRVLNRFKIKLLKFTFLEVRPKTGRTHQIRVHMKFINHPVVCDPLYDAGGFCIKEIGRLALHAKSISFKDLKGETMKIESKLPQEFLNLPL
ncbi:MAG: RluA family pseudouridine synthase [bacterium]